MDEINSIQFDVLNKGKTSLEERYGYLKSAYEASTLTEDFFKTPCELHNGKGDAFRHTLWNLLSSRRIVSHTTKLLTTAHEDTPPRYAYNRKENDLDLFDNEVGRNLVLSVSSNPAMDVLNALNDVQLRYLSNQNSNCEATCDSELIPTNQ